MNLCVLIVCLFLGVSLLSLLSFSLGKCQNRQKCHGLIFEYSPCFSLRNKVPMLSLRKRWNVRSFIPLCSAICIAWAVVKAGGSRLTIACCWLLSAFSLRIFWTLNADSLKYSVSLMACSTVNRSIQVLSYSPQVHRANWIIRQKRVMYISSLYLQAQMRLLSNTEISALMMFLIRSVQ